MKKDFKKQFDEVKVLYSIAIALFVVGILALIWFAYQGVAARRARQALVTLPQEQEVGQDDDREQCKRFRYDGQCLGEGEAQPQMIAIMVENHIEARDLSGIQEASIVYEAPVEGNITRFMALYPADAKVEKVGPVRSARPYYLQWLSEYGNAMYMHVGGSPKALEEIEEFGIFDLNEFYHGWDYWRSEDRSAPHNVYTSSELWNDALEQEDHEVRDFEMWKYAMPTSTCQSDCFERVAISYSSPYYKPVWTWDRDSNRYLRSERGNSIAYVADSVVIMYTRSTVLDEVGRLALFTKGEGLVQIFQNGNMVEGLWKKGERTDRTRFVDNKGKEIGLHPGKVWVTVVTQSTDVDYIGEQ
ncbi:DUF3048 domain-containing protein [Candidatus Nomurabacteria bacterium]|nr:DUF3048 domain-containing protein [Candidatus Nomurabacteria bacterium]